MNKRVSFISAILAAACLGAVCTRAAAAEPPTVTELYRRALVVMNDLPEPAFVSNRLEGTMDGPPLKIGTEGCGSLQIPRQQDWQLQSRTRDSETVVVDTKTGRRHSIGLSPTWLWTYAALRRPVLFAGPFPCEAAPASPAPTPTPAPSPFPALKVIGTVVALGPGIYNIEDRGATTCPNGNPGHALHLWSRTNDPRQQLSDVVIELQSMRFCVVRFGTRLGTGISFAATFEQHFADVGGYWIQTDGLAEATQRIAGIAALHSVWRYRFLDTKYPNAIPPDVFAVPVATGQPAFDPAPYVHPQRLVDIGGRRLNVYCTGRGSPTVVLEAGGGDDMLDWRYVQPLLAKQVRVCSYDRAGFGFSDPGPLPRDGSAIVGDLHALLARAGITGPFVLVGYSSGELYSRLYADRYLSDLAGLVFVEPAAEGDQEVKGHAASPQVAAESAREAAIAKACAAASAHHPLQPNDALYGVCIPGVDQQLPDALNALIVQQSRRPGWWNGYVSENVEAAPATLGEVRSEQRSYGNLPLVVVTAKSAFAQGYLPPGEQQSVQKILDDGRTALFGYSARSSRVVTDRCSHGDIVTRCAADVAAAITNVIDASRSRP